MSMTTPSRADALSVRLGRYGTAFMAGLNMLIAVVAGGALIGSFVVPGGAVPWYRNAEFATVSPGAPMKVALPALKVTAPVVPIAIQEDGSLDPPRDYLEVGWWNASAKPGASQGQTIITGHTLHTGGASMNRLGELQIDDQVDVITKRGTMRYVTTKKVVYSKKELSEKAEELFAQDRGNGRLVLITCTDWDGKDYQSNIVVFARPLGEPIDKTPAPAEQPAKA
jgi:LPXTG-site transpeptidase (sortase) family protein